jgi:hypothetical protein
MDEDDVDPHELAQIPDGLRGDLADVCDELVALRREQGASPSISIRSKSRAASITAEDFEQTHQTGASRSSSDGTDP